MSSKRKFTSLGLERRVRARRGDEWKAGPEPSDGSELDESGSEEVEEDGSGDEDEGSDTKSNPESEGSDDEEHPKADFSSVSFGALARAQASLPPPERKRKTAKGDTSSPITTKRDPSRRDAKFAERKEVEKRSSKHAPQEVSSKRPVTRRREIVADPRRKARDPRFDGVSGRLDESKVAKNYAFLDEYRDSEMAELRAQMKKTKDVNVKEDLKRQIMSMDSKKKARQKKEEEEKILQEHRQNEKELVAQGKQPFYLRKSEQKKQALMSRFAGMKKSQVDKAIERKRKKVASKEKKELVSLERRRH